MGLDDLTEDVREEVNSLDDDEIKDHADRVSLLSQIAINLDGRTERLESRISDLESRVDELEKQQEQISCEDSGESFLEGVEGEQEDDNDSPWA